MTFLKRAMWAAAATAVMAGGASAQLGGATGGGGTGGGLGGGTGGGLGGLGGLLGGSGGLGGGQGGGGNSAGTNSGVSSVTITAPSSYAQNPQGVATSNVVGKYYANPMYQGRAGVTTSSATSVVNPGGFGTALYGTSGGAASGGTGTGGGRGGAGGTSGGFGSSSGGVGGGGFGSTGGGTNRQGGGGGLAGGGTGTQQSAQVIAQGATSLSYTASVKFATPTVTPAQFQAELRGVIDRTSSLSNPAGVEVIVGAGNVVTLRGRVKDDDEARLAEGLLRITPGVRDVQNQLTFPRQ